LLDLDISSIGPLNNHFSGSPKKKGLLPIIFDVNMQSRKDPFSPVPLFPTSTSTAEDSLGSHVNVNVIPTLATPSFSFFNGMFTPSAFSSGSGGGYFNLPLASPAPLTKSFSASSLSSGSGSTPTPSSSFGSFLSFPVPGDKAPSSTPDSTGSFSFTPNPLAGLPYELETPGTFMKKMNSVLIDSPHPLQSPSSAFSSSTAVASSVVGSRAALKRTTTSGGYDSVRKEINPFSMDARVTSAAASKADPFSEKTPSSFLLSSLLSTGSGMTPSLLYGSSGNTPSFISSEFTGALRGEDVTFGQTRHSLPLMTPPLLSSWQTSYFYHADRSQVDLPASQFIRERDVFPTLAEPVSRAKNTPARSSPRASAKGKAAAQGNTLMENARLLDVKEDELPTQFVDNHLKSRKRKSVGNDELAINEDDDVKVQLTPLAEIAVPRKKKGVEEDEETLARKKLRRKERFLGLSFFFSERTNPFVFVVLLLLLLRCRLAATKFRKKKKKVADVLDRDAEAVTVHNELIMHDISKLKARLVELKSFMLDHKTCFSRANVTTNST